MAEPPDKKANDTMPKKKIWKKTTHTSASQETRENRVSTYFSKYSRHTDKIAGKSSNETAKIGD